MADPSRHDAWQAGDRYELYMGRWSRQVAPLFLDWLGAEAGLDWLDVGCGTGALSATILARCDPRSLIGIDASDGFVAAAAQALADPRATFRTGDATALPLEDASRDVAVSALMLNFVPDRAKALAEMKRVVRPGGTVAFYVWDYPGGGQEMMRAFWSAATDLDSAAADLSEDRRFPFCTPEALTELAGNVSLMSVECSAFVVPTVFRSFEDFWHPFTLGAGPAPAYCASLSEDARRRLEDRLRETLPTGEDGTISLSARSWAVKGRA